MTRQVPNTSRHRRRTTGTWSATPCAPASSSSRRRALLTPRRPSSVVRRRRRSVASSSSASVRRRVLSRSLGSVCRPSRRRRDGSSESGAIARSSALRRDDPLTIAPKRTDPTPPDPYRRAQGEQGDFFYVVEHGEFRFIVDGKPVGNCHDGASFGEVRFVPFCSVPFRSVPFRSVLSPSCHTEAHTRASPCSTPTTERGNEQQPSRAHDGHVPRDGALSVRGVSSRSSTARRARRRSSRRRPRRCGGCSGSCSARPSRTRPRARRAPTCRRSPRSSCFRASPRTSCTRSVGAGRRRSRTRARRDETRR